MHTALLANLFELRLEKANTPADLAAVDFKLRFTWPAHADPT